MQSRDLTPTKIPDAVPAGHPAVHLPAAAPPVEGSVQLTEAAQAFLGEAQGLTDVPPTPALITIHHKEGMFVLPTGELADEVSGYIIQYFTTRKYYKSAKPEKGRRPDCYSLDLVAPSADCVEPQSELCATCNMNQFGTGRDGRSKACTEPVWLFLYNLEFGNPPVALLTASTASMVAMKGSGAMKQGYLQKAKKKAGAYQMVWTVFRLAHLGDQVEYSVLDPVMGPVLQDPAQARALATFCNKFRVVMDAYRGKAADLGNEVLPS